MEKRLITFIALAVLLFVGNQMLRIWLVPRPPKPVAKIEVNAPADENADENGDKAAEKVDEQPARLQGDKAGNEADAAADRAADEAAPAKPPVPAPVAVPEERVTLGSADDKSGYRELITITNRGAAVERIELNSPKYLDQEDRSGYLGQLDLIDAPNNQNGALVRVVGPGTPAAEAGLAVGDVITEFNGKPVMWAEEFDKAIGKTEPGAKFQLGIRRGEQELELDGRLRRRPMQVIRPETSGQLKNPDPLSFLLTLDSLDGERIPKDAEELPGVTMRTSNWKILPRDNEDEVALAYDLTEQGLQVIKRFKLAKIDAADIDDPAAAAYHLQFAIEVRNLGEKSHKLAWRLEGPTGLPLEGAWYAMKIGRNWSGGAGMRDVVVGFLHNGAVRPGMVSATTLGSDKPVTPWQVEPLEYIGVDSQYFAVAMLPERANPQDVTYSEALPIRVGEVPAERVFLNRTNVSFRLVSPVEKIAPNGKPFVQNYKVFAGPKRPQLLAQYNLGTLVYYGMFGWVSEPMLAVLHFFYRIIPNYGIAIILLTVLVRSLMFPISRRQAQSAQKMQEIQPELKRIQEKYKGKLEELSKAQRELYRKHNFHPLAGCLPAFVQLPIFIGLYRSLAVDVELRGAPLISESIRWCSNLAAPDMLWHWERFLPDMLSGPNGWLGPYFNLLPCISAGLFIFQQKKMMPPPADEQAAMTQKVMQYMTIFIGIMFFKVASGLCLYFIATSLWSMTERKLLPKKNVPGTPGAPSTIDVRSNPPRGANGNGATDTKRKNRGRT